MEEYLNTQCDQEAVEGLADALEVIYSLVGEHKVSIEELEYLRKTKANKRGAFKEKIFLIEVGD